MTKEGFYTNKYVTTKQKITERDRYEALKLYFDICDSDEDGLVSKEEAVRLFRQIDAFRIPKFRNELFGRLERYLGLFYDDYIKDWNACRLEKEEKNYA